MRRFLLVDDEIHILQALQRTCEIAFDIVIADFLMPHMNGVEFL